MKSSTYYFHVNTKILADFQIFKGSKPPLLLPENRKVSSDFTKRALIVSIFVLNFPFKLYLCSFLLAFLRNCLSSALVP